MKESKMWMPLLGLSCACLGVGFLLGSMMQEFSDVMRLEDVLQSSAQPTLDAFIESTTLMSAYRWVAVGGGLLGLLLIVLWAVPLASRRTHT